MKPYLLILENSGLIAYHKTDGVYRTTYKGMHFLRTYNHTFAPQFRKVIRSESIP
jgi:predicted transcriptional regulator